MKPSLTADAHCHLSDPRITDPDELIRLAAAAGVGEFLMAGVDSFDWKRQLKLAQRHSQIHCCFGLHPYQCASLNDLDIESELSELRKFLPQARALGETGLDYREGYKEHKEKQIRVFRIQLELAIEFSKPLVLHIVQAHGDALEILKNYHSRLTSPVMIHAFNSSAEVAKLYCEMGFYLSIGSAITFERHKKLQKAAVEIPLDQLLIESDCPDQAPQGWPHPLNAPQSVIQVAQSLSGLRGENPEDILQRASSNLRVFLSERL